PQPHHRVWVVVASSVPVLPGGDSIFTNLLENQNLPKVSGQSQEEKKRWNTKCPRGQHRDTICFRQLLCPDPSCEVCNSTTVEVNRLLFLEDLEDDTASVSSLASTASGTESSFTLSSAFSEVPPGDLTPSPPPDPSPPPPSVLSPKPMTPLADFLSPSHGSLYATRAFSSLGVQTPWRTIPHPNPLTFSLSHHMTPRQRILFSNQRPLCLRIRSSLLTAPFPKILNP
uniref:SPATA31-like domain-containing protein n=1 Tax=Equus caballus TaxID=9796 RepID=A0A9L0TJQ7_HORSE